MTDLILYSDGTPDCIEAHRLLVLARANHLVHTYQHDPAQSMPKLLHPSSTQRWIGLTQIRHYLRTYKVTEPPAPSDQPPNHPPHDDHMMASIAAITSQGGKI